MNRCPHCNGLVNPLRIHFSLDQRPRPYECPRCQGLSYFTGEQRAILSGIAAVLAGALGGIIIFVWDTQVCLVVLLIGAILRQVMVWTFGRLVPWSDGDHVS
jgi:hypothetical protein